MSSIHSLGAAEGAHAFKKYVASSENPARAASTTAAASEKSAVTEIVRRALLSNPSVLNSVKYDHPSAYIDVYPKGVKLFERSSPCPSPLSLESPGKGGF